MLNKVIIMGRITRDLELKQTPQGTSVLSFTVAVDRNFVKQGEERQTDFINCVAWRQTAEFISRFFGKGRMIAIEGSLRVRNYEDSNGNKRTATEVYVDNASFTGEPRQNGGYSQNYGQQGGYQQNSYQQGGYNQGYQNNNSYQQNQNTYQSAPAAPVPPAPAAQEEPLNIGGMDDFELLGDEGVPF